MKKARIKMLNLHRMVGGVSGALFILFVVLILSSCKDDSEPKDTIAPEVSFENLADEAKIWNTVSVTLSAADQNGVKSIDFYVDGNLITSLTESPFEISWDSNTVPDGSHILKVIATDKAGNVTEKQISVTVSNVLVTVTSNANAISVGGSFTDRGFVFLSDENGKVIAAQEYGNNESIVFKNPAFAGEKFYLSQVHIYQKNSFTENRIFTFAEIERGRTWSLAEFEGKDQAYVGEATLNFSGAAADASYNVNSYGDDTWADELNLTQNVRLYKSPSKLYVVRYNLGASAPVKYNLYPSIAIGPNAINLISVNKNLTKGTVTAPSAGDVTIQLTGYPVANNYEERYKIGRFSDDGSVDYYYPGTEFPSYYGEIFWETSEVYYSKGSSVSDFTIKPLEKNVSISFNADKFTYTATGNFDFISTGFGDGDNSWGFLLPKGTNMVVPKLELPDMLNQFELVSFRAPLDYTIYDFEGVNDYTDLKNYLQSHYTLLEDFYADGKNYTDEMHYLLPAGGRVGKNKSFSGISSFRRKKQ